MGFSRFTALRYSPDKKYRDNGTVPERHWSVEFKKQVLPRFRKPFNGPGDEPIVVEELRLDMKAEEGVVWNCWLMSVGLYCCDIPVEVVSDVDDGW